MKIPFLLTAFFDPFVIEATLLSLQPYGNRIDIIVVENPSKFSHLIGDVVKKFTDCGLVAKHYRFEENITGNAMLTILRNEIDLARYPYLFISDGDIIAYRDGWLEEIIQAMDRHPDVFALGANLDRCNLPLSTMPEARGWGAGARPIDRGDYFEGRNGFQMTCFRGRELKELIIYLDEGNLEFRDGVLEDYCYKVRGQKWGITKYTTFRHLTWDSYSDLGHPYTRFKASKTFEEHWVHRNVSAYYEVTASSPRSLNNVPIASWPAKTKIERRNYLKWAVINWLVKSRLSWILGLLPFLKQ